MEVQKKKWQINSGFPEASLENIKRQCLESSSTSIHSWKTTIRFTRITIRPYVIHDKGGEPKESPEDDGYFNIEIGPQGGCHFPR